MPWRAHLRAGSETGYGTNTTAIAALSIAILALPRVVRADPPADVPREQPAVVDPSGGGYTSPTLLFTPAVAVPAWNARVIASVDGQTPADVHAQIRPGLGGELGLPGGVTLGAGTRWVGGDVKPDTGKTDFNLGLSPYFQARVHVVGSGDGRGLQFGVGATYKFVGFEGDPGEVELGLSLQYRSRLYELGVEAVVGQDLAETSNRDGEAHLYAVARPIPQLALGAAGQARIALQRPADPEERSWDVLGGAIASLTLQRFQIGALTGASTLGVENGRVGALGELFGTVRF
jgi:hypothetical protein